MKITTFTTQKLGRQLLVSSLLINLLLLAPTVYMMEVYDRVVNSRSLATLLWLLGAVLLAYWLTEVLEWRRSVRLLELSERVDRHWRQRIFDAMFQARRELLPSGTPQAMHDFRTVRDFLSSHLAPAFLDLPMSLIFLLAVLLIHPSMALFAMLGGLVQFLLGLRTDRVISQSQVLSGRASSAATSYVAGALSAAEVVQSMGMLPVVRERWLAFQRQYLYLQARAAEQVGLTAVTSRMAQTAQGSLMLGLGCWLSLMGIISSTGALMIVASILGARMLAPMVQIIAQWRQLVDARESWSRLQALLVKIPERQPGLSLPRPSGHLQVESLTATAPGQSVPLLRNIHFQISAGECLAVVGPSASGKTTLARLLVGAWPSQAGHVRLDGADVHSWDKDELGAWLGYLPQTIELFDGTLAENIARFGPEDESMMAQAVALSGLQDLVESLPAGLQTPAGPAGAFLSGGQRQRVGLARAVYGLPSLVVLDEPNASLDEAGEQLLLDMLQRLRELGTTVVLVTHRVKPLQAADKILVLRDGAQQAFGARDEVLSALSAAGKAV